MAFYKSYPKTGALPFVDFLFSKVVLDYINHVELYLVLPVLLSSRYVAFVIQQRLDMSFTYFQREMETGVFKHKIEIIQLQCGIERETRAAMCE